MVSLVQSLLLAAGTAAISTIITATVVFHLANRPDEVDDDESLTKSGKIRLPRDPVEQCLKSWGECVHKPSMFEEKANDYVWPKVAWLMSFPNSGTSFTIHATRHLSNCTTATNYALEGLIRDKPSVPAIPGPAGEKGPFLEFIPNLATNIPSRYILTKTHCAGFCDDCTPNAYVETPRSFQIGCQSGNQAVQTEFGLKNVPVTYNISIVKKAIHIIRHPLDNVVARFHLFLSTKKLHHRTVGNATVPIHYPNNRTGFQNWCRRLDLDQTPLINASRWMDDRLKQALSDIPCQAELYRYVQWHNLAFSMSRDLALPTLVVHYDDYKDHLERTLRRISNFLQLPRVVRTQMKFENGKDNRDFYSKNQRKAVQRYLKEAATVETWQSLKSYKFH